TLSYFCWTFMSGYRDPGRASSAAEANRPGSVNPLPASHVEGALVAGERRLADHLGHRGVRMADPADVLGRRLELHRHRRLRDEIARVVGDDVHPEDLVGLRVGDQLTKPSG